MIDATHAPARRSWVEAANGHADFPIQNLPLGIFCPAGRAPRGGVAIGDHILDLAAALEAGLFRGESRRAAEAASGEALNPLLALGAGPRRALRAVVADLLDADGPDRAKLERHRGRLLHQAGDCVMRLPVRIGDYTDFFAGIYHAANTGRLFRPDNPLLPNYKYVPVAYHGRASSVTPSGVPVRRPNGQRRLAGDTVPSFGPARSLDYELELGIWIGPGNPLGEPVPIAEAARHIAGFCLLNDWSARDIQAWESQPLGPFLAKNFATTVSAWIVTPEALAPFRIAQPARPEGDPKPLPHLSDDADQRAGALDIELEALLLTPGLKAKGAAPHRLSRSNARHLYWTVAQMLAHHTSGGCNLEPGDLFGSGTVSAPDASGFGSLLETTEGGRRPIELASGETRRFLEDGDEVIVRAHCRREGAAAIGFGECRASVLPAR
jgi:fumarylacetoacetase